MNKNDQTFLVQKIRAQYIPTQATPLDELKTLDKKVKKPANVFAWAFGVFAAMIMGSGMSLVMTDIGAILGLASPMIPGIVIGVLGMTMALVNYPIYKALLTVRQKKYAPQILELSNALMQ